MQDRLVDHRAFAADLAPSCIALRREIHANPELGWDEVATTERLASFLIERGLEPRVRPARTGLTVEVGTGDRIVGFRADIDALPIQELSDVGYASTVPGVMHACGHDAHAAIGAGLAVALHRSSHLDGRVRFIFQPAEELIPGGATVLREEGVLDGLSALIAYHLDPSIPAGTVGLRAGAITGASDRLVITLSGPGGHTSRPHLTVNLIAAAAHIVSNLPDVLRSRVDPRTIMSVVFGRINGGFAENVIPATIEIGGTIRVLDLDLWREMPTVIEAIVADLAATFEAHAKVEYVAGAPPVVNDESIIGTIGAAATAALAPGSVVATHQSLGSEDFSWYLQELPGALVRLGAGIPGRNLDLHSATFDLDETAIEHGINLGAEMLIRLVSE